MKPLLLSLMTAAMLAAQTAEPPRLEIVLSLNGRDGATIQPGEALIAAATFLSTEQTRERAATATLTLWTPDGTQIEHGMRERESTVSLTEGQELVLRVWTVSPEVTTNLAPGEYLAWLETEGQPPAQARIKVEASIPADDADHQALRHLILSHWLQLEAQFDQALAQAEELITLQPGNLAARIRKADVLIAAGRLEEALPVLDDAELQYHALNPEGAHPPRLIQLRQQKVLNALGRGDDTLDGVSSGKP
ncbi:tetratricopeptide repeat protein [Paludibaculum fermentans]|uniref:Tetratricopeptide repeat protein n=1 Tax=Paludibaculum fermentans TaxID=1473598 RepID=A0A7S7NT52_PALFE|nr:tetratricopeptide repeat protein [Paludibaculum fermentans]QOY89357.1 tetratricopeptide repeat protein [Paludibaculum fermentans]